MRAVIRQAVVLAGGLGSRLGTLTAETPKPLLTVGGRPFIEWVIANLRRHGVEDVVLAAGYRADAFEAWLATFAGNGAVDIFVEEEPLDTGGALTLMGDRLQETFFVLNGDTLFDAPLQALGAMLGTTSCDVSVALRQTPDAEGYGSVELAGARLKSFSEKTAKGAGWINGGAYAVRRASLAGYRPPLSLERDFLPELVQHGRVTGLPCDGFFIDIGLPRSYQEAQASVPAWWHSTGDGLAPGP